MKKIKKRKKQKNSSYLFLSIILLIVFLLVIILFFSLVKMDNSTKSFNSIETITIESNYNVNNKDYEVNQDDDLNKKKYTDSFSQNNFIITNPNEKKESKNKKSICIIIDDYGYQDNAYFLINLPFHISVSILPGLPYSKSGFEIFSKSSNITPMLHIPMEAINNHKGEKVELKSSDNEEEIIRKLDLFFSEIPASFANNHMGSKVSISENTVKIILNYLLKKGIRFIDSHTINNSFFSSVGKNLGFPVFENNLFLDYNTNIDLPEMEFKKGLTILKNRNYIIIIGHNTKEQTINFLKKLASSEYISLYNFINVRELFENF